MKIENFQDLLTKALHGDMETLLKWHDYHVSQSFQPQEINMALITIDAILSQEDHLQRSHALTLRAYMHTKGIGGKVNLEKAVELYSEAVALQNTTAMYNLAFLYEQGATGEPNYLKAIRLYEQAIALGDSNAMNNRACMHCNPQVGPVDYAKAIRLFEKAIDLNNPFAKNNLAIVYEQGLEGKINPDLELGFYQRAADQELEFDAMARLHNETTCPLSERYRQANLTFFSKHPQRNNIEVDPVYSDHQVVAGPK